MHLVQRFLVTPSGASTGGFRSQGPLSIHRGLVEVTLPLLYDALSSSGVRDSNLGTKPFSWPGPGGILGARADYRVNSNRFASLYQLIAPQKSSFDFSKDFTLYSCASLATNTAATSPTTTLVSNKPFYLVQNALTGTIGASISQGNSGGTTNALGFVLINGTVLLTPEITLPVGAVFHVFVSGTFSGGTLTLVCCVIVGSSLTKQSASVAYAGGSALVNPLWIRTGRQKNDSLVGDRVFYFGALWARALSDAEMLGVFMDPGLLVSMAFSRNRMIHPNTIFRRTSQLSVARIGSRGSQ